MNDIDAGVKSDATTDVIGKFEQIDLPIKETSENEITCENKYFCEECHRNFRQSGSYLKHKQLYPFKHKYYECCKKVEEGSQEHVCQRKVNVRKSAKVMKLENENNDPWGDDCGVPADGSESEEEDVDEFNEIFKKQKRSYKRKTADEKMEEEKMKIFKCEDCSKSFNRYTSLVFHTKVVHEKQGYLKCHVCEEEFATRQDYKNHVKNHGPEDKVVCKGCRKVFDSLKSYQVHAKQNPGVHCFLCKLCLRKFPSELVLEQHVCICQNGKPLHCACGKEFTKYKDVIAHSKGTKPFHCCSCSHLAVSLTAYIRHLRKHSKQKPYQCTKCDMKFAIIDFLKIHMKREHKEDLDERPELLTGYKCADCGEEFGTAEELTKHGSDHERVQCPDCGKFFKRNRLENHRNTHKKSASLCPECGKLFDARFKLTQHMITIHNAEPVKCEVCGKVLKTKKILNEHMKTHLKSEVGLRIPQAICPQCGLGLAQKGSLARHILLVHEKHKIVPSDKTYTCQECSEVLPNKGKYYSHRRMHRAMVDRFPCEICGRVFNKKQNLRRHIYLLHDEKRIIEIPIYGCQVCTRTFREKKNLRRHYKMVHKMDDVFVT